MARVRFAVIGVGPWGELHAKALARCPDAELAAVCDLNENRARILTATTGAKMYYTNYEGLLADDNIDAVTIATPADGPSFGVAPSGTCTWMSLRSNSDGGMPKSTDRDLT